MATSSVSSSGIDVQTLVSQLMTVERQPITRLNNQENSYQAKLSAYGTVKSAVSTFQAAVQKLNSTSSFQVLKATPADTSILTATASSSAVAGTYSLEVSSLAQSQQLVAAGQASSTATIGGGATTTLSFDFGTISGGTFDSVTGKYTGASFASSGGGVKTVTIDNTNNTLEGIRDAINTANIGVSATIVNDGSGSPYRLVLSSNTSGASNSMSISVSGEAAIGSLLSNDPTGTQNLAQTVTAQNANLKVNGISVTKSSNTITDAIQGVTLNLLSKTTSATTLTVSKDNSATTASAESLVKAYNDLYSVLKGISAYDPVTKTGGALQGDSSIRSMMSQLRTILSTSVSGGAYSTLAEVGITTQAGGTLKLDSTKFTAAVNSNQADVANLFASSGGYANTLNDWATSALNITINSRTSGISERISSIGKQISTLEARMITIEQRYRTQFTSLDKMLSSMSSTSSYLTQQLARL